MSKKVKYIEKNDALKIEIFPKLKKIIIFGYSFFYIMPFVVFILLSIYIFINDIIRIKKNDLFIMLCIFIASLTIAFIFLRRIFEKEVIIINNKELIIKKVMLITLSKKKYSLKYIKDLTFVGREEFTEHYLNLKGFDYLGIGTGEKEVHFMIEEGTIEFEYLGTKVRFGKNIYFEELDELMFRLKKYVKFSHHLAK